MAVGRILAGDKPLGIGFALATGLGEPSRVALTANHVVRGREVSSLRFALTDGRTVSVEGVEGDEILDVAVLRLGEAVLEALAVGEAVEGAAWKVGAQPLPNDPQLHGIISTARLPYLNDKGHATHAMQLRVDEHVGDYKGYSGGPVVQPSTGALIGVLVEQQYLRLQSSPSSLGQHRLAGNVLYAIPIQDVVDRFGLAAARAEPASSPADVALAAAEERLSAMPLDIPEPSALPPGSRMPLSPNPLFVGREADLRSLVRSLKAGETAAIGQVPIAAASGLGGVGKTQLAAEFAHRYGRYFAGGVYWLSFADADAVPAQVAGCGGVGCMDLPAFGDLRFEDQVESVLAAWRSPMPRLLVFDNCEDEGLLDRWRPPTGGCRLLVTGRRERWDPVLGVRTLPLGALDRGESVELLRNHRPDLPNSDPDLAAIALELGDLPLALYLAGSYLDTYRHAITPADYLVQLRNPRLLDHRSLHKCGISPTGHEQSVARTFALSYDRLDTSDPTDATALALLARAACFASGEPIPRDLLRTTLDLDDDGGPDAALGAEDALARLTGLGLLETEAGGALRLHRLVAAFVGSVATNGGAREAVERAVLDTVVPLNRAGYPAPLLPLEPHLRAVTDRAAEREDERAAFLCNALGYYLGMIGGYDRAKPYYERALEINGRVLGREHPRTALALNNLARLLSEQGEYAEAMPLLERALEISRRVLGPEHPYTAIFLDNLAGLLQNQGQYAEARPLLQRALEIDERSYGLEHPGVATDLDNLAGLLRDQGRYAEARPLLQRALRIREKVQGSEHPHTATSLDNLGCLLQSQGEYAEARPLLERALKIREKVQGPEHPHTATSLNNLAGLLLDQGQYAEARPLLERALEIRGRVLGPDHLDTATSLANLGGLLSEQGEYAGARPLYERALAIRQKVLGLEHPDTALSLDNLAGLLRDQGEYAEARPLLERVLGVREKILGPEHPHIATSLSNFARLLWDQGQYAEARPLLERALAIAERAYGPEHPQTRIIRQNLEMLG